MYSLFSYLYQIDLLLLRFINRDLVNPIFDIIMPFVSKPYGWQIFVSLILIIIFIKGDKTVRLKWLLIIITLAISDQISASIIKPLVGRIRPCNYLDGIRYYQYNEKMWEIIPRMHLFIIKKSYSFPSAHAVNFFAFATIFSLLFNNYKKLSISFFLLAFIVSFSRVYLGVHYPSDVIFGGMIGYYIAFLVYKLINLKFKNLLQNTT